MHKGNAQRGMLASFQDALRGISSCLSTERHMRIHLAACVFVLFLGVALPLTRGERACLLLAMGAVTAAEAMNTAVERLCDFVQKRRSPLIGAVKDIAAGSVLLAALFAAGVGAVVLVRPELWQLFRSIFSSPLKAAGFVVAAGVALFFVCRQPKGRPGR